MSETSDEILDMKMHEIQKLATKHFLELFQASLCRHLPAWGLNIKGKSLSYSSKL